MTIFEALCEKIMMDGVWARAGLRDDFVAALDESGACIAGSASLHAIRARFGMVDAWEPNDIDVWLPWTSYGETDAWGAVAPLRGVLERSGFAHKKDGHIGYRSYSYAKVHNIARIFTFSHAARGMDVQIILVRGLAVKNVAQRFDLSVCKVVWTPELGFGHTAEEVVQDVRASRAVLTKGDLYNLNTRAEVEAKVARTRTRVAKYARRGFDIVGEREALLPVLVRWRLAEWSRQDHAFFPEDFKVTVKALVTAVWVTHLLPQASVEVIIDCMWRIECVESQHDGLVRPTHCI